MIIFKRKQAVLILVVCMILVAGYINWAYQKDTSTNIASELASTEITTENNDDENKEIIETQSENLGQAALVNASATTTRKVTETAREARDNARNKSVEMLKETINNQSVDQKSRETAQSQLTMIASNAEKEGICEGLIETKVAPAVVFISDGNASITVDTTELDETGATRIKDIIVTHAGISADKIKISTAK